MLDIRTILFPTDLSDCSENAFKLALKLARDYQACLIVLHVDKPPRYTTHDYQLEDRLRQAYPAYATAEIQYRVAEGDPFSKILETAKKCECDLIVMGTHDRHGQEWWLGSVAEQVLRNAPCPVVTIRPPSAQASAMAS